MRTAGVRGVAGDEAEVEVVGAAFNGSGRLAFLFGLIFVFFCMLHFVLRAFCLEVGLCRCTVVFSYIAVVVFGGCQSARVRSPVSRDFGIS